MLGFYNDFHSYIFEAIQKLMNEMKSLILVSCGEEKVQATVHTSLHGCSYKCTQQQWPLLSCSSFRISQHGVLSAIVWLTWPYELLFPSGILFKVKGDMMHLTPTEGPWDKWLSFSEPQFPQLGNETDTCTKWHVWRASSAWGTVDSSKSAHFLLFPGSIPTPGVLYIFVQDLVALSECCLVLGYLVCTHAFL